MVLKAGTTPDAADVRFGEQVTRTVTRDSKGRVSQIVINSANPTSTSTITINRDSKGRISSIVATGDFSRTTTLTRDTTGRVTAMVTT